MHSVHSRHAWIEASHFHDLSEGEVFGKIRKLATQADRPVVLFDLDSTLYEVGPRTYAILKEWVHTQASLENPGLRAAIGQLQEHEVGYSLADTLSRVGQVPDEQLKAFWSARFFSNAYLRLDRPYPGAAQFARDLHDLGLEVIYLTGRDEPGMGDGTRANLLRDQFPWEVPRTHLLLKSEFGKPDLQHKQQAALYVQKQGELIASFENEPANLVALADIFPRAMHIFVETIFSDHPAPLGRDLYRIRGFGASASR